ncbi:MULTISPECIES: hypothetical protein [unclassified Arthrobacter]|uniref:hypothetical protein n=1 Tax=unclassified Arthrobacter TaxID=235627 RepID=UPI0012B536B3|nr:MULTISPECIES: hypothetical protein [unclassified Arthrobacter]
MTAGVLVIEQKMLERLPVLKQNTAFGSMKSPSKVFTVVGGRITVLDRRATITVL